MNDADKQVYVDYRLATAKEFLDDARMLIGLDRLKSAANRMYYAMFQAVSALALADGFQTRSHTQLMGWFNKNLSSPVMCREPLAQDMGVPLT